jgi:hypothetical protein
MRNLSQFVFIEFDKISSQTSGRSWPGTRTEKTWRHVPVQGYLGVETRKAFSFRSIERQILFQDRIHALYLSSLQFSQSTSSGRQQSAAFYYRVKSSVDESCKPVKCLRPRPFRHKEIESSKFNSWECLSLETMTTGWRCATHLPSKHNLYSIPNSPTWLTSCSF